jgi:Ca-activated chloride channel homolog
MRQNLRLSPPAVLTLALAVALGPSVSGQSSRSRRVTPPQADVAQRQAGGQPTAQQPAKPQQPAKAQPARPGEQPPPGKPAEKPAEDAGEVLRIESKLIAVPVSVTDTAGQPVRDLKPEDFRLMEEGQPQQLTALGEPGQTPVELALLFDVSASVSERFKFEQEAAARFLRSVLKPKDAVSVFSVGFGPKLVQPRTTNIEQAVAAMMKLEPTREGTAFFDTLVQAAQYLGQSAETGTRRVVVVISDGEDNNSDRYRLKDALREVQRGDVLFYAINPSGPSIKLNKVSTKGHEGMQSLAGETGGVAFLPDKIEDLDPIFKQIAAELQAQYLLGYYSSDERADGGFRRIAVNVPKRPDLRIRARQGYYAPKA